MTQFLLQLGIMSLQASVIICVVLFLRFFFSKLHIAKKYTNLLWVIPYIAMVLPWGIKTPFSFWNITKDGQTKVEQVVNTMPYQTDRFVEMASPTLPEDLPERYAPPTIDEITNLQAGNDVGNTVESMAENTVSNVETAINNLPRFLTEMSVWDVVITTLFIVWFVGMLAFLGYGVLSSLKLKKKLVCSLLLRENVYVADDIKEPFVFGVFSSKIYLPCNLTRDNEFYVIEHEKTHIKRKDPMKKVVAFVITGIHWFNPFAWLAFHMMTKDMEMACDEETVQRIGAEKRQDYATALLDLSTKKRNLLIPVAFGEGNVKSRIKNVLQYKKTVKVLVVLAAILIVVVAGVFLTKPTETTTTLSQLRAEDGPMVMPSKDSPREITVTYNGESITFPTGYYDFFRVFLEELEVSKEELNKSRSEDRPTDIVICVEGGAAYNFDKHMTTIWCNNGVKPSFTYEVTEPKLAISFIEGQITSYKEANTSYVDAVPEYTDEQMAEVELCGENGPFLDYADDKYVVFHTTTRFYVYDMEIGEMIWGIGLGNIIDVEVSKEGRKAYVYDMDIDAISVYECDIENGDCQFYVLPTCELFEDFYVTSQSVQHDPTVYRTTECVKLADGSYVYLESGSGLVLDLVVVRESADRERTVHDLFTVNSYDIEMPQTIQILQDGTFTETIDITHDGKEEYIVVDMQEIMSDGQAAAYLKVMDSDGKLLWEKEMFLASAGWDSYFLVQTSEGDYLMQYLPIVYQEQGTYSYRVFYLDEKGNEIEVASQNVDFSPYVLNSSVSAKEAIPYDEMYSFANNANAYLKFARLMVSTVDGVLRYQTPGKIYTYEENYQSVLEMLDIQASSSIELNITKLQNKYEKTKEAVLSNQVQIKQ